MPPDGRRIRRRFLKGDHPQMDRPDWQTWFLQFAHLAAQRSTCPRRQVGAVLVYDRRIIATGYNGSLPGQPHCTEAGCLLDAEGHCRRTLHAELNALLQASRFGSRVAGSTLYVTDAPCPDCARAVVQAGVAAVVVDRAYGDGAGIAVLEAAGVSVTRTIPPALPLLGIVGPAGAGKDTVAQWLQQHYHYMPVALADPLRPFIRQLFPDQPRNRTLYQQLADWVRSHHDTAFIEVVARRIAHGGPWVITDVRFPIEAEWITQRGGTLIGVDAPEPVRIARILRRDGQDGIRTLDHASEQAIPHLLRRCRILLANAGPLEALYQQCVERLGSWLRVYQATTPHVSQEADHASTPSLG